MSLLIDQTVHLAKVNHFEFIFNQLTKFNFLNALSDLPQPINRSIIGCKKLYSYYYITNIVYVN